MENTFEVKNNEFLNTSKIYCQKCNALLDEDKVVILNYKMKKISLCEACKNEFDNEVKERVETINRYITLKRRRKAFISLFVTVLMTAIICLPLGLNEKFLAVSIVGPIGMIFSFFLSSIFFKNTKPIYFWLSIVGIMDWDDFVEFIRDSRYGLLYWRNPKLYIKLWGVLGGLLISPIFMVLSIFLFPISLNRNLNSNNGGLERETLRIRNEICSSILDK